ncbi:MAG: S9 family peptidase [Pseudomonadota bacterium]
MGFRIFKPALVLALLTVCGPVAAEYYSDWLKPREILNAKISPQGDYIAALKEEDERRQLAIFEYPAMKLIHVVSLPGKNEVGNYWWVNDERVLIRVDYDWGNREDDVSYGELYAVNADGKKGKYLFGFRGDQNGRTKSRVSKVSTTAASARLMHPRWQDPKTVLIQITEWNRGYNNITKSAVLDIYSGRLTRELRAPVPNANLIADAEGNVRFAFYIDDDQTGVFFVREDNKWEEFSSAAYGETQVEPLELDAEGNLYVYRSDDGGPKGLYLLNPETNEFTELVQHDVVDIDGTLMDFRGNVYGAVVAPDKYEQVITDPDHPNAQTRLALAASFPDVMPSITSQTHDFRLNLVSFTSDKETPSVYLFDRETNRLQKMFDGFPHVPDEILPEMEPIQIEARDGTQLYGYLSRPKGAPQKNLPLVIVPHGGPHGPRDYWGYQWFEGWIPAAGYAMLQVNFRGSGGYGQNFENAGHKEWAGKMQDDLTDSVRWAIDQGIADPERVCIFGWSYGGYAAVMSIAREPELYKCSVAGAGVYDQKVQYDNADFTEFTRWGKKYMDKVIGKTAEDLVAASPITYVDEIKTPLLLVHGEDDLRVPVEHAYELRKAMKAAGKPVPRLIELKNEGHTPRNAKNNRRWISETVKFIEQHIGKGHPPKA